MDSKDKEMEIVEKHVNQLAEHFDTVHIFATRQDSTEDGTVNISFGAGNWFARYGQIREFLVKSDERTRKHVQESD